MDLEQIYLFLADRTYCSNKVRGRYQERNVFNMLFSVFYECFRKEELYTAFELYRKVRTSSVDPDYAYSWSRYRWSNYGIDIPIDKDDSLFLSFLVEDVSHGDKEIFYNTLKVYFLIDYNTVIPVSIF